MPQRISGFRGEFLWEWDVVEPQLLQLANAFEAGDYGWQPDTSARGVDGCARRATWAYAKPAASESARKSGSQLNDQGAGCTRRAYRTGVPASVLPGRAGYARRARRLAG